MQRFKCKGFWRNKFSPAPLSPQCDSIKLLRNVNIQAICQVNSYLVESQLTRMRCSALQTCHCVREKAEGPQKHKNHCRLTLSRLAFSFQKLLAPRASLLQTSILKDRVSLKHMSFGVILCGFGLLALFLINCMISADHLPSLGMFPLL